MEVCVYVANLARDWGITANTAQGLATLATRIDVAALFHPTRLSNSGGLTFQLLRPAHQIHKFRAIAARVLSKRRGRNLFGRCERKNGIASFDRLVAQTMSQRPLSPSAEGVLDRRQRHRTPWPRRRANSAPAFPTSCSSTVPSTRAGSIRSRSTSLCSSVRCSHN